jgi:hypothetical protein
VVGHECLLHDLIEKKEPFPRDEGEVDFNSVRDNVANVFWTETSLIITMGKAVYSTPSIDGRRHNREGRGKQALQSTGKDVSSRARKGLK